MSKPDVELADLSNIELLGAFGAACGIEMAGKKISPDGPWTVLAAEILRRLNKAQEETK